MGHRTRAAYHVPRMLRPHVRGGVVTPQLALPFAEPRSLPEPSEWLERFALPMTGLASYQVLVRSPDDPERRSRKERQQSPDYATSWKRLDDASPEQWATLFVDLLKTCEPMTFNALVLTVTGGAFTADVAAFGAPHLGLALALADGRLRISNSGPHRIAVSQRESAEED